MNTQSHYDHSIRLATESLPLPLNEEQASRLISLARYYVAVESNGMVESTEAAYNDVCEVLQGLEVAGGVMAADFELDLGDDNGEACHCLYITFTFQDTPEATTHYFFNLPN